MSIVSAAIGVGGSLLSGIMASDSAEDALAGQQQMSNQANALSQAQFEQTRTDNAPARLRGDAAGNRLALLMGLSGEGVGAGARPVTRSADRLRSDLVAGFTSGPSGQQLINPAYSNDYLGEDAANYRPYLSAGTPGKIDELGLAEAIRREGAVDAENMARYEAEQAANRANPEFGSLTRGFGATDLANDSIYGTFKDGIDKSLRDSSAELDQRRQFAGGMMRNFGMSDFEKEPGYQFRMEEGNRNIENSAAARGSLLSGAALKAMQRFGQDFASNEFGRASDRFNNNRSFAANELGNSFNRNQTNLNFASGQREGAYNRFNTNQGNQFNRLASISGAGQQAINTVNSAGAVNAQQQGNNLIGMGNAQAASSIAQGNAMQGMIGSIGNTIQGGLQRNNRDNLMRKIQQPDYNLVNGTYAD